MTENSETYLGPIITESGRLRREAVRRRKPFDEKAIVPEVISVHEAEGWQVDRQLMEAGLVSYRRLFSSKHHYFPRFSPTTPAKSGTHLLTFL